MSEDTPDTERPAASYDDYPRNGEVAAPDEYTLTVDGQPYPVSQFEVIGPDLVATIDVGAAVERGCTFDGIWRHRTVPVETPVESFTARIIGCEIEHGSATLRLSGTDPEEDGDG